MDLLPQLPTKSYSSLRHDIRSGDLLLCSGNFVFSKLIQNATGSIWSHVAFILRLDAIDRIMVLESVESIGVRTVPLSHYVYNYNASGKPYPGRLMLARHCDVKAAQIPNLSRTAVDLLGQPYRSEEIAHIATRISEYRLGLSTAPVDTNTRGFICSEYVKICMQSIGVNIQHNEMGFIAPADFARDSNITPIAFLENQEIHSNSAA
jgi:hypothetical protein